MTNATKFVENQTYRMTHTETLEVDGENQIHLSFTPIPGTISIAYDNGTTGMMEEITGTAVAGKFIRDVSVASDPKLQFAANDVGAKVEVSYYYTETVREANIDNRSSAMGEAVMQWPVYGNGDDCTDASIIGYVTVKVYRARVTAQPGFDSSYKTANTFQFTIAAINFLWLCLVKGIENSSKRGNSQFYY